MVHRQSLHSFLVFSKEFFINIANLLNTDNSLITQFYDISCNFFGHIIIYFIILVGYTICLSYSIFFFAHSITQTMNSQNVRERQTQIPVYAPFSFKSDSRHDKKYNGPLTFQKSSVPSSTIQSIHQSISQTSSVNKSNIVISHSVVTSHCEQPPIPESLQYQNDMLDISEELLLSSQSISSKKNVGESFICPIHLKNQEIICMIDRVKICAHCALFGNHKDHSFKAEAQIIEEVFKRRKEIGEIDLLREKMIDPNRMDSQWAKLKDQCKNRQRQLVSEVQNEYDVLIKRIQVLRKQAQQKIIEKSNNLQHQLIEHQNLYRRQIKSSIKLQQWLSKGGRILDDLMKNLDNPCTFTHSFNEYELFTWRQGADIVQEYRKILSRSKEKISRSISQMTSLPLLHTLIGNIKHDQLSSSHIQFASEANTSFTSIDDFQWVNHRVKTECNQLSQYDNQFLQIKDFGSNRKSELLQTIQEANRNEMKFIDKNQRMSAKCFSKKNNFSSSKKQNKYLGSTSHSTFLQGKKSQSKLQTSILPPKPRLTSPRSFNTSKQKNDPMMKLREYQLNECSRFLDLSDCGLSEDSLVYFLEKAQKLRPPQEVNLQRNHIAICGFSKLIPYLSSCRKINLSYCGVGENCLDSLLRCKQLKVLAECVLIGNQINQRKAKTKIQQLSKAGIKIILL